MAKARTQQKPKKDKIFRKRLEEQRREILDMYEHDLKVGQRSSDEGAEDLVDRANSAYDREFMLSLSAGERDILFEINEAITRLDDGRYGVCGQCDETIPGNRLQAIPWARYCIDCQEQAELGLMPDD